MSTSIQFYVRVVKNLLRIDFIDLQSDFLNKCIDLAIWIGCTALWWYIHSNRSAAKIALTNSLTPTKSGSDAATTTISTPIAAMTPPAATTASSSSMTPEQPLKTTSVVNEEGDENSNEEG